MAKNTLLSEADIDDILASVEKTLEQTQALAKSAPLKKDDGQMPEEESAPAGEAPAPEAPAPEAEAPQSEAPAPEAEQAPEQEQPAEELQDEQQDGPLSDEELAQVYGSMDHEELMRHQHIIEQFMAQGQEQEQPAPEAEQPAPAPEAAPQPEMGKSEDVKALLSEIAELRKAQEMQIKAFEILTAPTRKAVTGIEFVKKSEAEEVKVELNKSEINAKLAEISPSNLSKSEREVINGYLLNNQDKEKVVEIIRTKGGK